MIRQLRRGQELEIFDNDEFHPSGKWIRGTVVEVANGNVKIRWEDLPMLTEYDIDDKNLQNARFIKQSFFWSFVHNVVAHPLLITGAKWADDFHDWTANKI